MSAVLGAASALVMFWALWHRRGHSQNLRRLPVVRAPGRRAVAPGRRVTLPYADRFKLSNREQQTLLVALMLTVLLTFVLPVAGALVLPSATAHIWWRRRVQRAKFFRAVGRDVPLAIELLRLAVRSGCNVTAAVTHLGEHMQGPLADAFLRSLASAGHGQRLADALEHHTNELGHEVKPLIWSLVAAERYGSPLSEVLERLAHETRLTQERKVEQAAKRLSVQLLFPVAGCTLPAFALLTVAPLLAGSLSTLASSFR